MPGRTLAFICCGLFAVACTDDATGQDVGGTMDTDPNCAFEGVVDVHFAYDTQSESESHTCELLFFDETSTTDLLVQTDCGFDVELEGVSPPPTSLLVGDSVELNSLVDDPMGLGCAESGWLVIHDEQGRMQFAAMSVLSSASSLLLADLGEVELQEDSQAGCAGLRLIGEDDEVYIPSATSAEVEFAGARLLVQVGPFNSTSSVGCGPERYSAVLFRLPG